MALNHDSIHPVLTDLVPKLLRPFPVKILLLIEIVEQQIDIFLHHRDRHFRKRSHDILHLRQLNPQTTQLDLFVLPPAVNQPAVSRK